MAKASRSIDLRPAKDASKTATNFITVNENNGIRVHEAGAVDTNFVQINNDGMQIYKDGDQDSNIIAKFEADGAQIGLDTGPHTIIDNDGMQIFAEEVSGGSIVELANIGYGEGNTESGTGYAPYYSLGTRRRASNVYDNTATYKVGDLVLYDNPQKTYVCITDITTPEAWTQSHWKLAIGTYSIAEGFNTTASGQRSHTEGTATVAIAAASHAEGVGSIASGGGSHAGGFGSIASGQYSFAYGHKAKATAQDSIALGPYAEATRIGDIALGSGVLIDGNGNLSVAGNYTSAMSGCGATATISLTTNTSGVKIPITTYRDKVGNYLSISNGGIKCEKKGHVEISGNVYFIDGFTANSLVHAIVKKNSQDIINAVHRLPSHYDYYSIPPLVFNVSAGDILYLHAYNQTDAKGKVAGDNRTWLTVKYL